MNGEQVGEVPVPVVGVIPVFGPFLELTPFADLWTKKARSHGCHFVAERFVYVHRLRSFDVVGEQVVHQLLLIGIALSFRTVFGRDALGADEFSVGPFDQGVLPKLAQFIEQRIGPVFQVFLVQCESIMIPDVLHDPGCVAGDPFIGRSPEDAVF